MKKVPCYETTDGQLFKSQRDAANHQKELDFGKWYSENTLYGNTNGSYVETSDLEDWLHRNKDVILNYLK